MVMTSTNFVKTVQTYNRADCCGDRLSNYLVRVGDNSDHTKNPKCPGVFSGA